MTIENWGVPKACWSKTEDGKEIRVCELGSSLEVGNSPDSAAGGRFGRSLVGPIGRGSEALFSAMENETQKAKQSKEKRNEFCVYVWEFCWLALTFSFILLTFVITLSRSFVPGTRRCFFRY